MTATKTIDVAICTWNRAALLHETLSRLCGLQLPAGVDFRLLVVDNCSTDNTANVIESFAGRLPIQPLYEPKQGHSHARNLALQAAAGDLLIWTDDDVLVDPNWLTAYVDAAERFPDAAYFGGAVEPWFETTPPRWVTRNLHLMQGPFALCHWDQSVAPLEPGDVVVGASMAFRRSVWEQRRFNTSLGRVGDLLISGDDREMIDALHAAGHYGVRVGTARLKHFVPTSRMNTAYLHQWYIGSGRSQVRRNKFGAAPMICGAPRWMWKKYLLQSCRAVATAPIGGPAWFNAFRERAFLKGAIAEYRERRFGEPSGTTSPQATAQK